MENIELAENRNLKENVAQKFKRKKKSTLAQSHSPLKTTFTPKV